MYGSVYKLAKPPQSPSHTYPEAICKGVYSDSYSKSCMGLDYQLRIRRETKCPVVVLTDTVDPYMIQTAFPASPLVNVCQDSWWTVNAKGIEISLYATMDPWPCTYDIMQAQICRPEHIAQLYTLN